MITLHNTRQNQIYRGKKKSVKVKMLEPLNLRVSMPSTITIGVRTRNVVQCVQIDSLNQLEQHAAENQQEFMN